MFCNKCGKEMPENSEYCQYCGTKIKNDMPNEKQILLDKGWFIVLMVCFVYPFGMFLMWSKKKFNLLVRLIFSIFFGFIFLGVLSGMFSGVKESENNETKKETTVKESIAETTETSIVAEITTETEETIEKVIKKIDVQNIIEQFNETLGAIMEKTDPCIKILSVEKEPEDEYITIDVIVYDTTDAKTAMDIADSVLRSLNTTANMLDSSYKLSSDKYYGGLYDEYKAEISVLKESDIKNIDSWYIYDTISDGYDMVQLQDIKETKEKKDFLEVIKESIEGEIEGEEYKKINFENRDIYILVDMSNAKKIFGEKDLAIMTIETITDEILKQKEYFNDWDSIMIDFGEIGSILLDKTYIVSNPYGMIYFDFPDDMLNTKTKDKNSIKRNIDLSNFNTEPLKRVSKDKLKLETGELLEANGFYGDVVVIKAKISPLFNNKQTIDQNYYNIKDLIQRQGLDDAKEIQYWAVADMTNGEESKCISFTVPNDLIKDIKENRVLEPNVFFNRVIDYWLLPSLRE